jgi:hypothetical protein
MVAVLAIAVAVEAAAWVPARWNTSDPKSLELLRDTPINCLLMERPDPGFVKQAAQQGIRVAVIGTDVELYPRASLKLDAPVVATSEGLWPGVRVEQKAAATGGPWVETNYGFLAYVRAAAGDAPVWIANQPPAKTVLKPEKYMHAISDAAIAGARWVLALDSDFEKRLLARDAGALRDWGLVTEHLKFYEEHREWNRWAPYGRLAIVQDTAGAMYSGGILDMIAVKHTPVRAVPVRALKPEMLEGAQMAVNADPDAIPSERKEALRAFTRGGGTLLTAPPGWKLPPPSAGEITLSKEDVQKIDEVWKGINGMIGRANLGARLFNVGGMLSSLTSDGKRVAVQLVNYTDYPVEAIAIHVLGKFSKASLHEPGKPVRSLETYEVQDGTGVDVPEVKVAATVVLESGL